ncbi:unnamed protein product, partial [Meganyctiphanes norvegica]
MDSGVPNGRVCKLRPTRVANGPILLFPTRAAKMIASPLIFYKSCKWCSSLISYKSCKWCILLFPTRAANGAVFLFPTTRLIGASPLKVRYTYPDETYLSGLAKKKK